MNKHKHNDVEAIRNRSIINSGKPISRKLICCAIAITHNTN